MPIIRKFAVQGHAVPSGYQSPRGPFPPELFFQPRGESDTDHGDSLHEALDDVRYFRCKDCDTVINEYQLLSHDCDEEE